jgi:hypothetical protein
LSLGIGAARGRLLYGALDVGQEGRKKKKKTKSAKRASGASIARRSTSTDVISRWK